MLDNQYLREAFSQSGRAPLDPPGQPKLNRKFLALLETSGVLDREQFAYFLEFRAALANCLETEPNAVIKRSLSHTLEKKIENSLGATAYATHLPATVTPENMRKLVQGLCALQFLADLGDTVSDQFPADSQSLVEQIYDLTRRLGAESPAADFIKATLQAVLQLDQTGLARELFELRWQAFVTYELCSMQPSTETYRAALYASYPPLAQALQRHGLEHRLPIPQTDEIEFVASKGGMVYLHNLLRVMVTGEDLAQQIATFDHENSVCDWLNFLLDHWVDLYTDLGFADLEDFLNRLTPLQTVVQNNALHLIVMRNLGLAEADLLTRAARERYVEEARVYFTYIIEQTLYQVRRSKSVNYYLIDLMVRYFLVSVPADPWFAKAILDYALTVELDKRPLASPPPTHALRRIAPMKSRMITHKGHTIFYVDYSSLDIGGLKAEIAAVEAETLRRPANSVLAIIDVRGVIFTPAIMEAVRQSSVRTKLQVRKAAVLGVTGVRKSLLDMVIRFSGQQISAHDDLEAAKDWLVAVH
jgi:hypothetical protein